MTKDFKQHGINLGFRQVQTYSDFAYVISSIIKEGNFCANFLVKKEASQDLSASGIVCLPLLI